MENDKDLMEKDKDTLTRKINQKEDEMKDKVKEIEELKVHIGKKEKEFTKFQKDLYFTYQ